MYQHARIHLYCFENLAFRFKFDRADVSIVYSESGLLGRGRCKRRTGRFFLHGFQRPRGFMEKAFLTSRIE